MGFDEGLIRPDIRLGRAAPPMACALSQTVADFRYEMRAVRGMSFKAVFEGGGGGAPATKEAASRSDLRADS
jgi:hypothetical protein